MTDNERKARAWITAEVLRQHGWKAWPVLAGPIEVVSFDVALQVLLAVVRAKGEAIAGDLEDTHRQVRIWLPDERPDTIEALETAFRNVRVRGAYPPPHAADVPEPPR